MPAANSIRDGDDLSENELDELLDDALEDLEKPESTKSNLNDWADDFLSQEIAAKAKISETTGSTFQARVDQNLDATASKTASAAAATSTDTRPKQPFDMGLVNDDLDPATAEQLEAFVAQLSSQFDSSFGKVEEALKKGMADRGLEDDADVKLTDEEIESLLSNVIKGLLTRDLLYEPVKDLAQMYAKYMRDHESRITSEDAKTYKEQKACCDFVTEVFETYKKDDDIPKETRREMETKLQKLQDLGQPPAEIVKEMGGLPQLFQGGKQQEPGADGLGDCPVQ